MGIYLYFWGLRMMRKDHAEGTNNVYITEGIKALGSIRAGINS